MIAPKKVDVLLSTENAVDTDEMDQVTCPFCGAMFDTILADVVECSCCGAKIDLTENEGDEE